MNCKNARQFLYAFADGELSVKDNCDLLDHLKMCPECTRIVSDQQALRGEVKGMLDAARAPAHLRERILQAVETEDESAAPAQPTASYDSHPAFNWRRLFVPLAAAASIALVVYVSWSSFRPLQAAPAVSANLVTRGGSAASRVVTVHLACCEKAERHHCKDLPRECDRVAAAMTDHFQGMVRALAPDLSQSGYRIESANYCGVRPRHPGAHVIYVAETGNRRLSFFSTPRWSCLDRCAGQRASSDSDCRSFCVEFERERYAVVAWHDNQTTYVCCGETSIEDLTRIVEPVRTAMMKNPITESHFAMLWQPADR